MLEKCTKHEAIVKAQEFIGIVTMPQPKPKPEEPILPEERTAILTRIFESFKNGLNHPVSVRPKEYVKNATLTLKCWK